MGARSYGAQLYAQSWRCLPVTEHYTDGLAYIVQGVDMYGRKFAGLYNETDARSLATADRLNIVLDRATQRVINFTR